MNVGISSVSKGRKLGSLGSSKYGLFNNLNHSSCKCVQVEGKSLMLKNLIKGEGIVIIIDLENRAKKIVKQVWTTNDDG